MRLENAGKLLAAILCFAVTIGAVFAALEKGAKAPDFKLKTPDGKEVSLRDIRKASPKREAPKVVLVDFWATWCGPCRDSIPNLQGLHEEYGKKGLAVVGISLDRNPRTVNSFAKKEKLTYTLLCDPDKEVAREYKVQFLPTMYLMDKDGVIRHVFTGFSEDTEREIEKAVKEMLK